MKLVVNGEPRELVDGTTVALLVDDLGRGRKGLAVAVNDEVVPRSTWDAVELQADDRVEVLVASKGG